MGSSFSVAPRALDLPIFDSTYPGVAIASGAQANVFGAWVELSADVGVGRKLIGITVSVSDTFGVTWEAEIGEGAGAAEAPVARVTGVNKWYSAAGNQAPGTFYPLWRALTANARLSVRIKDPEAAERGFIVSAVVAEV